MNRREQDRNLDETLALLGQSARRSVPPEPAPDLVPNVLRRVRGARSASPSPAAPYPLWTALAAAAAIVFVLLGYQAWATLIDPLEQMIEMTQFLPV